MDIDKISELISQDEEELFIGCFCESTIRADLAFRREKRDYYIQAFNKFIDDHRDIINYMEMQQPTATDLIEKCRKCKKEASRLLDIVFSY